MRVLLLVVLGAGLAWYVANSAYKSFMVEKHGVWRPEPTDEDPYREVSRLNGAVRRNYDLLQADILWNKLGESDPVVAAQWREKRAEFARRSRRTSATH